MDNRKRLPTPPPSHPCPEPSGWVAEAAGARCAKARQGAQPWGSGVQAPAWERPRRGGDRASEARRGGYGRPLWGLFMPVAGAQLLAHETFRSLVC